jgi:hypothetical protein
MCLSKIVILSRMRADIVSATSLLVLFVGPLLFLRHLDFTAACASSTRLISGVRGALRLGILFLKG